MNRCKLNLIHDRDTSEGYVSGNGCWYSALGVELGVYGGYFSRVPEESRIENLLKDQFVFHKFIPEYRLRTFRYPDNIALDSHDNILAHLYFGSLEDEDLTKTGYYINNTLPSDFTWIECIKDIIRLVKDHGFKPHRNVWHEQGYNAIAKIANRLPRWLIYYSSKKLRYYPTFILHIFASYFKRNYKKDYRHTDANGNARWVMERQTNNVSAKIQCYFMLRTTGSRYLIKLFDIKKLVKIYFGEDHELYKALLT